MAEVREIRIPVIRLSIGAPWHFFAFAIALIPAAAISLAAGNRTALISAVLSAASAVLSLFLMRKILRKKSSLVIPIGIALGCAVAFFLPRGFPIWVAPAVVCASVVVSQIVSTQNVIHVNMGLVAVACALATRYALGVAIAPPSDILAGIDPDKMLHDFANALLDEGKNASPAFSPFSLIPAAIVLLSMGAVRIRSLLYPLAGAAILVAALYLTGHDVLFLALWRIALAPFIFVVMFFFPDPLSSSKTYAGRTATALISGALWPFVFFISGNLLLATAAVLSVTLITPLIDKITVPRPFGPVGEKK